jgi:hypothetical protein
VHFALKTGIARAGGRLESPGFKFEDTPENRFVETILAGAAELERNQNREQVVRRMRARLELGFWPFPAPPGYRFGPHPQHKRVLLVDPATGQLVRQGLEGFATGELPRIFDLIRFLAAGGLFEGQAARRAAHRSEVVRRMLGNVLYTGHVEFTDWKVGRRKGFHEALISMETFQRIQDRLRQAEDRPRADASRDFPLRGQVACAECGRKLTASWSAGRSGRYAYYHCYNGECPARGRTIRADTLEADYAELLRSVEPRPEALDQIEAAVRAAWRDEEREERQAMEAAPKRLAAVEAELSRLADKLVLVSAAAAVRAVEEKMAALDREAAKLRQLPSSPGSDDRLVGTAISCGLSFVASPFQTWLSGAWETKRQVSTVVFTCPPRYRRHHGFGTPELSLPWRLSARFSGQNTRMVDLDQNSWKQLLDWLLINGPMIQSMLANEKGAPTVDC